MREPRDPSALTDILLELAQTDAPPAFNLIPPQLQLFMRKIAMCGPTRAAAPRRNPRKDRYLHDMPCFMVF